MGKRTRDRQPTMWVPTTDLPTAAQPPVLSALESAAARARVRRLRRSAVRWLLCRDDGPARIAAGDLFSAAADRLFRGHRRRARHRLARGGLVGVARLPGHRAGPGAAGPLDDFADATADRAGNASSRLHVDPAVSGTAGLVKGKTIGVDATTLEANAALRSIVRRDTGESYEEFLTTLAKASGIETPTRADLARLDRKRKKKGSNDDWTHPHDPDARITKMKDGRTHLAHKAEHAIVRPARSSASRCKARTRATRLRSLYNGLLKRCVSRSTRRRRSRTSHVASRWTPPTREAPIAAFTGAADR